MNGWSLEGKVAIVTGATSGIGAAIAMGLARQGAKLAICGRRESEGKAVAAEIAAANGTALFVACDVGDAGAVKGFVGQTVSTFGRLDIAVNCAGISCPDTKLADLAEADFDTMIRINLRGVFLAMKYEIRQLLAQKSGGSIINMSSVLAHAVMGAPALYSAPHYVAAKHGVEGLTKSAAMEYGRDGIRVNSISPGIIATAFSEHLVEADVPVIRNFVAQTALGRLGRVGDIVGAAQYLASDAASYVTGTTIAVDGGYLAQ